MVLGFCNGGIRDPLDELPGWGLVCGVRSVAGGGFALHDFSLYLNVA